MISHFFEGCDMHLSPAQWCRCCDGGDDRDIPDAARSERSKERDIDGLEESRGPAEHIGCLMENAKLQRCWFGFSEASGVVMRA